LCTLWIEIFTVVFPTFCITSFSTHAQHIDLLVKNFVTNCH